MPLDGSATAGYAIFFAEMSAGHSELDPELVALPRAKPRIGPVLAASILVLCLFLGWKLRADVWFAREQNALPVKVEQAWPDNRFVTVTSGFDLASATHVFYTKGEFGQRLLPLLNAPDAPTKFVLLPASSADTGSSLTFSGRVRYLRDLPIFDAVVEHARTTVRVARAVPIAEMQAAIAAGKATLHDVTGQSFTVTPQTQVSLSVLRAQEATIRCYATDQYQNLDIWRNALLAAGLIRIGQEAEEVDEGMWAFRVPAPEGVSKISAQLIAAKIFAAQAEPSTAHYETFLGDLRFEPDTLAMKNGREMLVDVQAFLVWTAPNVPNGSEQVIVASDVPNNFRHVPWVLGLLVGLSLLFGFGLFWSLRPLFRPQK